jgi:hypothetical protein
LAETSQDPSAFWQPEAEVEAVLTTFASGTLLKERPDWDEFRRDMVVDGRLAVGLHFDHAYGMVPTS